MFVITEKVVLNDSVVGYGGYLVSKKLTGNNVESGKMYINLNVTRKLASNFFLGVYVGGTEIGRFSNFGVVGFDEDGELNLAHDLTYMKRCVLGYTTPCENSVSDLLPTIDVDAVDNFVAINSLYNQTHGLDTCKEINVRRFLYRTNISVLHMCIDILGYNGYTLDAESLDYGEITGAIKFKTTDTSKKYTTLYIENRMLKIYSEIYTLVGVTKEGNHEEMVSTCDINNLAMALHNYANM